MISKTIGFRGLAYFQTHPHFGDSKIFPGTETNIQGAGRWYSGAPVWRLPLPLFLRGEKCLPVAQLPHLKQIIHLYPSLIWQMGLSENVVYRNTPNMAILYHDGRHRPIFFGVESSPVTNGTSTGPQKKNRTIFLGWTENRCCFFSTILSSSSNFKYIYIILDVSENWVHPAIWRGWW